jgi:hypothetical protein
MAGPASWAGEKLPAQPMMNDINFLMKWAKP